MFIEFHTVYCPEITFCEENEHFIHKYVHCTRLFRRLVCDYYF